MRILTAKLAVVVATLMLAFSGITPSQAATECTAWSTDANGEFICTEWTNTDPSGGGSSTAPTGLQVLARTSTSFKLGWDPYTGASGWVISFSSDNATTWKELVVQNPDAFTGVSLTDLTPATAMWVRVAALTPDRTPFSDAEFVTTKGAKAVTVKVVDSVGRPVQGGQITWAMVDGSARSSKTYGLTDQGLIVFPSAPAGPVKVTITDVLTSQGALVSGTWRTTLGFPNPVLHLPEGDISAHNVKVVLENGLPVSGAKVTIPEPQPVYGFGCVESTTIPVWIDDDIDADGNLIPGHYEYHEYCTKSGRTVIDYQGGLQIDSTAVFNGFTFSSPVGPYASDTDINGVSTIYGFLPSDAVATVTYDDGVITQEQQVPLTTSTTRVQLDYMPYVQPDQPVVTTSSSQLTPITVSVNDAGISTNAFHIGRPFMNAKKGVKVSLIAPKGSYKTSCKNKLSAVSDKFGKATFYVCATKSTVFKIKGAGAAPVGGVRVQVKNTAPMQVTKASAKSKALGQATVSWSKSTFDGSSTVVGYRVVFTAKGKKTVTKNVAAKTLSVTATGLANATTYTVEIFAINKWGSSPASTITVPVA